LFLYRLRIFLTIGVALAVTAGIFYTIWQRQTQDDIDSFNLQVTADVATAIQSALYNVTRTVEAPHNRFRVMRLGENTSLAAVAEQNGTTLELLRMVNQLADDVTDGNGQLIIVPLNIVELDPPRVLQTYIVQPGDTLVAIAERNGLPLSLLESDNPILASRGLIPGDTVFVGTEIIF
jgi:LysM repeat protein